MDGKPIHTEQHHMEVAKMKKIRKAVARLLRHCLKSLETKESNSKETLESTIDVSHFDGATDEEKRLVITEQTLSLLVRKIDISKALEYGQLLIEYNENGARITTGGEVPEHTYIEKPSIYEQNSGNAEDITLLCKIAYAVRFQTDYDPTKHAEYRFCCGLEPNGDTSLDELHKYISPEATHKLYEKGYEIIKRPAGF